MNFQASPSATSRAAVAALWIIFAANFFNYLDRQLVSAVEKQLRGDTTLSLSKTEYGLLWTLFTVGYMVCAMPIGYLADRYSRTRLFAACVAVWSVATIATGLAQWKPILFVARVFIGVGEAGCLVIGPSLISDLFTRQRRGRALALFYLGMPLGGTAAFILAAVLLELNLTWRELFFLAGAPGFLIALLIWVMTDPSRGASEATEDPASHGHHASGSARLGDYVQLLRNRTLLLIIMAQAFAVTVLIPLIHFGKKYFMDKHELGERRASLVLLMVMGVGAVGTVLAGRIGDRMARRRKGAYALLAGIGFLVAWPCLVLGFNSSTAWLYLPALALGSFFCFMCMPAVNTQIANVVNPAQRGAAWALAVFILHLLGDAVAPPVFGHVSEHLAQQQMVEQPMTHHEAETKATQTTFGIFSLALAPAVLCCFLAVLTAAGDIARFVEQPAQDSRRKEAKAVEAV